MTAERRTGFYNPFTASGTIIVDGVVASVQSKWFADDIMDRLGLTHAIPALYQARLLALRKQSFIAGTSSSVGQNLRCELHCLCVDLSPQAVDCRSDSADKAPCNSATVV